MLSPAFIIADASCVNRPGLVKLLTTNFTGAAITEVADATALTAAAAHEWYDVVFADVHLLPGGGFTAARDILQVCSDYRIILYAHHNTLQDMVQAFAAGAAAFFNCNEPEETILHKIREVLEKGGCITPVEFAAYKAAHSPVPQQVQHNKPLTLREKEVLGFVCKGLSNQKIADTLYLSVKTIENHRSSIRDKTGCHNTAQLILHVNKNGGV